MVDKIRKAVARDILKSTADFILECVTPITRAQKKRAKILSEIDYENIPLKELDKILHGYWTPLSCEVCRAGSNKDILEECYEFRLPVMFSEDKETVTLCKDCLRKALEL